MCNEELGRDRVRDHDHLTGLYRGAAHADCNLHCNFKDFKIPVFFHNLKNYDAHLIIGEANKFDCNKISVIAQNSEKFITFSFDKLQFKDSFSFLSSSLEKLVKLNKYVDGKLRDNWQDNFRYSRTSPYIKDDYDLNLLTEKGVYPYDYMSDESRFKETQLPPK